METKERTRKRRKLKFKNREHKDFEVPIKDKTKQPRLKKLKPKDIRYEDYDPV